MHNYFCLLDWYKNLEWYDRVLECSSLVSFMALIQKTKRKPCCFFIAKLCPPSCRAFTLIFCIKSQRCELEASFKYNNGLHWSRQACPVFKTELSSYRSLNTRKPGHLIRCYIGIFGTGKNKLWLHLPEHLGHTLPSSNYSSAVVNEFSVLKTKVIFVPDRNF